MDQGARLSVSEPPKWEHDSAWPTLEGRPMVFIRRFELPKEAPFDLGRLAGARLYLFGGRKPDPDMPQPSFTVEYKLLEERPGSGGFTEHYLFQADDGAGVFYTSEAVHAQGKSDHESGCDRDLIGFGGDTGAAATKLAGVFNLPNAEIRALHAEYVVAGRPKNVKKWLSERLDGRFRWIQRKPRWIEGEGDWPYFDGNPMVYIGQAILRENAVTRQHLTYGTSAYLFGLASGETSAFAIYEQDIGEQTAEQHYRAEEMMEEFSMNPADIEVIRRCIEEGDKDVHLFILEHPKATESALKLLTSRGATKAIREAAERRLRR